MKTFIKSISLFSITTLLLYPGFIFIWGSLFPKDFKPNIVYSQGGHGYMYSRLQEVQNIEDIDIVFLGSSHTYRGFDTRVFKEVGIKSFNLGSSAQTPLQTQVLLNRYLDQLNPEVIVYEVYPKTFSIDGVESSLDIISSDQNDFGSIKMALKSNHLKIYNSLLYGLIHDFFNISLDDDPTKNEIGGTYVLGGYVERDVTYFKYTQYKPKEWVINDSQLSAFEGIVDFIKNRDIKLVLIYAPITSSLYHSYLNNDTFNKKMEEYSTYYNFNEMIQLDDSLHFYDADHLNQIGVEIFNKSVIEIIDEI